MNFYSEVNKAFGSARIRVEGFFTERVINLCKLENINIWNIKNITTGMIEFEIGIKDVKKIKNIIKKCKCRLKVVKKNGVYFKAFKYRKRKIIIVMAIILCISVAIYNKFVWNVRVEGNNIISEEEIKNVAKSAGIYIGAYKPKIDVNYIVKCIKKDLTDATWVGVEIKGNNAIIKISEKTKIPEEIIFDKSKIGDIVAKKSGVLTKVVAENGTIAHNEGSYVESGMTIIQGKIFSEYLGEIKVRASGIAKANVEYEFKNKYYYNEIVKEHVGNKKYSIGFSINNKEIYINYLNKTKKYDTLKKSKEINIFGIRISFDFYEFNELLETQITNTYEQLLDRARKDKEQYINTLITNENEYVSEIENITEIENGFEYRVVITVNEDIGSFKGE